MTVATSIEKESQTSGTQQSVSCPPKPLRVGLDDLPTELHLLITKQLTYPDALSLKHTCRYYYSLVDTGIKLKVAWLMERRSLHLECPNERCDLGSDLKFCRGSVRYVAGYCSCVSHLVNFSGQAPDAASPGAYGV